MRTALAVGALAAGAGASVASAAPVEIGPKPGALAGNGHLGAFPATASELCIGDKPVPPAVAPSGPLPRLVARVAPSRVRSGRRSCLRASARTEGGRRIANARLRLGSTRAGLGKRGSRRLCLRFRKAGVRKLTVSASGYRTARVKIRVLRVRR